MVSFLNRHDSYKQRSTHLVHLTRQRSDTEGINRTAAKHNNTKNQCVFIIKTRNVISMGIITNRNCKL